MPHKFDPRNLKKLEERKKILPPEEILRELGLAEGETMIDVGAGAGYFSLPAAGIVGASGRILAVDTSREMLDELASRAGEAGAKNIETALSSEYETGIPGESADFALLSTVLHEVEDRPRFLNEVRRTLKKGGRLAIVEWIRKPMEKGPPVNDRIDASEASEALKQLDFSDIRARNYNDFFYFVSAVK